MKLQLRALLLHLAVTGALFYFVFWFQNLVTR
jgi:hypothetical protein